MLCAAPPAAAEAIPLESARVALDARDPERQQVGALRYRGGLELRSSDRRFGGLSALLISPDGGRMTALLDRGHWFEARLIYVNHMLVAATEGALGPLLDGKGQPLGRYYRDAESLARLPDGSVVAAFESRHRLTRFAADDHEFARPRLLAPPPGLEAAPSNEGIEALTTLADGRLLALTEGLEPEPGVLAGWMGGDKDWQGLGLVRAKGFRPTGADTLQDGDVVVVERAFSFLEGPMARLRRIEKAQIKAGARLSGYELARLVAPLVVDNFEGVAVREGDRGETLIYLISDDNFKPWQRTLLLMFELVE